MRPRTSKPHIRLRAGRWACHDRDGGPDWCCGWGSTPARAFARWKARKRALVPIMVSIEHLLRLPTTPRPARDTRFDLPGVGPWLEFLLRPDPIAQAGETTPRGRR